MANLMFNRAVFGSGKPLSNADLDLIEEDEDLLLTLLLLRKESLLRRLREKYSIDREILEWVFQTDLTSFIGMLKHPGNTTRIEPFRKRLTNRLQVHKKNLVVIEKLIKDYDIPPKGFFDVGCLFGLSMACAANMGFQVAHGCEVDTKLFVRARNLISIAKRAFHSEIKLFEGDFAKLTLNRNFYNLVILNNVLEHTEDLDATIAKIAEILDDAGICYICQGNHLSLQFVLEEPHYRLPLLTILPKELATEILLRLKRFDRIDRYVVSHWPRLGELKEIFKKYGLSAHMPLETPGYYGQNNPLPFDQFGRYKAKIIDEGKIHIFPVLSAEERQRVETIMKDYFNTVEEGIHNNEPETAFLYLKPTWDIVLRKNHKDDGN